MSQIKPGTKILLEKGGWCTVTDFIGGGGQGDVYRVQYNGKYYALKWYKVEDKTRYLHEMVYYENIRKNVNNPLANFKESFLWPLYFAPRQLVAGEMSYGYVMDLLPNGYKEFTDFINRDINFASIEVLFDSCMRLCQAFMQLHAEGLCYRDINPRNIYADPQTGRIAIVDCDNVSSQGTIKLPIGQPGYTAPEVARDGIPCNKYTDYWSLSVILFHLIYGRHPMVGMATMASTPLEIDKNPVFVMDPDDNSNRAPDSSAAKPYGCLQFWPIFPHFLGEKFQEAFCAKRKENPSHRIIDKQWFKTLAKARAIFANCPRCGELNFVDFYRGGNCCAACDSDMSVCRLPVLRVGGYDIPLSVSGNHVKQIFGYMLEGDPTLPIDNVVAEVKREDGRLKMFNLTTRPWSVTNNSTGLTVSIGQGQGFACDGGGGFAINFGASSPSRPFATRGEIHVINT